MADPYALLSLTPEATPDEIRAAYRRLAAERHPDANPPEKKEWASEQMVQLNAARDLLLDPARRAKHDAAHAPRASGFESRNEARSGYARWSSGGGFTYEPPRAPPPRRRWYRRIPPGRMFVFMTLFIVALPYLWLFSSLGTGSTDGALAGLFGTLQCFSSGVIAAVVTLGLAAFLTALTRSLRR